MFFSKQSFESKEEYKKLLSTVGSLSNLFSESNTPYLYYRVAEKIFCQTFDTIDLGRGDVSVDTKKDSLGIGLKTFVSKNNKTFQKVTEFGSSGLSLYGSLKNKKKIIQIANIRNERINFTHRLHKLEKSIYHCVVREENQFSIFEESMDLIDINNIQDVKEKKGSITFNDGKNDYSFLLAKNTLTKRFNTLQTTTSFNVDILANPLELLSNCISQEKILFNNKMETIFLPLYGKNYTVFERSGLNQWNARGRQRDINEVYIPIPSIIHKKFPDFFPSRDYPFDLILPDESFMRSKVCQDGSKALMSYSNRELGKWILRDILKLEEGELLTYQKLQLLGIDSVRIDKIDTDSYRINFASSGSYEKFYMEYLID
jgi:hypothetical protein